ncbi:MULTISPECIES: SDR family oxidoreductase [unclassified Streptomyces]|uniref:SDR family oxidoreductase n=1 Tax=unclassified Streptomyces TaxID=2593676 RepID=UPI00037C5BF4|nr:MULTISPECIES: NAD(P)H-binding protein [unclassified Streptomyces]MYQ79783.1 NAD(P)H-binding protein [Streptomyces sp. SID4923]
MTILVTGARGRVGAAVVRELLAAGEKVRAASADPASLTALPDEVERVRLDLASPQGLHEALHGVQKIFLYAQPAGAARLTEAAATAGVGHIVLLSSLAIESHGADTSPIAQQHRLVEDVLRASGIGWTFVRAGGFATNALQWAEDIREGRPLRLAYPEAHSEPVHESDIAAVAVRALLDEAHRGATLRITGPQSLSARRQAELVGAAAGRDVLVRLITPEEYQKQLTAFVPEPVAATLVAYQAARDGRPQRTYDGVPEVLGRPAFSFAQWAEENADAFR